MKSNPGSSLVNIGISLKDLHESLIPKGKLKDTKGELRDVRDNKTVDFAYQPLNILYPPLKNIRPEGLNYEVFLELINKTDYNLRILVESLEKKLYQDNKGYQIEKARIEEKFRK